MQRGGDMSVGSQIEAAAISTFVDLIGHGSVFARIVSEIERTNAAMPSATGKDKRAKVLADLDIIFDDLIEPIAKNIINLLIELGVAYTYTQNPVLGQVAQQVGNVVTNELNASNRPELV